MIDKSTLNVSLTPELTASIAAKVASGQYRSASEVVRAALRILDRQDIAPSVPANSAALDRLPFNPVDLPPSSGAEMPRNRLLRALPPDDLHQLRSQLKKVPLRRMRTLHHAHVPIEHIYFVESGLVSAVGSTSDAEQGVEAYLIGYEGLAGVPVVLGARTVPHRRVVQADGEALRMSTADLRHAMEALPSFRAVLLRYTNHVLFQACQNAVCNARHALPARLARWLLMAHDRLERDELPLTHEVVGKMLGVRRASITTTLHALAEAGAVAGERKFVRVRDRDKLEQASCGCYRMLKPAFDRAADPAHGLGRPTSS